MPGRYYTPLRNIKFKVWDRAEKAMRFCLLVQWDMDRPGILTEVHTYPLRIYRTDGAPYRNLADVTLLQFTGMKDKNGTDIYEGDICDWRGEGNLIDGNRFIISWNDKRACWYLGGCLNPIDMPSVEVIGNIYENSDLIAKAEVT